MEPTVLLDGLGDRSDLEVMVPEGHTCKSTGGLKQFDFFVFSSDLAKGVASVKVVRETNLTPHFPVAAELHPSIGKLKSLAFRRPPPLPTVPV
eukprot:7607936-Pyramimonas_sp.AAC.1